MRKRGHGRDLQRRSFRCRPGQKGFERKPQRFRIDAGKLAHPQTNSEHAGGSRVACLRQHRFEGVGRNAELVHGDGNQHPVASGVEPAMPLVTMLVGVLSSVRGAQWIAWRGADRCSHALAGATILATGCVILVR